MATLSELLVCCSMIAVVSCARQEENKYLTYTVNMGEGFNLRRDVHMRAANLLRLLQRQSPADYKWTLVLPPWPRLYHWKSTVSQNWMPWEAFFDLESLNEFVPSIELSEYIEREGQSFDQILSLQRLQKPFTDGGEWIETALSEQCREQISTYHFGRGNFHSKVTECLSVQGRISVLLPQLLARAKISRSFLILRFEQLMHEEFGSLDYWRARSSMVYSKKLRDAGNLFMREQLNYDPGDGIGRSQPREGGGDYMAVHLRMQDYQQSKPHLVPSLRGVASQVRALKKEQNLKVVFIATDATESDKKKLKKLIGGKVVWLGTDSNFISRYGDGGVAIIDQWVSAHSKFFVGTTESTFSFRIREDRQFMKFSIDSTFNQLCGRQDNEHDPHSCAPPTKWLLVEETSTQQYHTEL